jgi:putative heme-binding domain-containing protein
MIWNFRVWLKLALLLELLVIGLWGFAASAQDAGNLYDTAVDVRLGERYFQRQCTRCHGEDAKGNDETGAPDLTGRLSRASTVAGIYRILREGIAGTAMLPLSPDTPDPTVWQLVAYVDSLSTDPANINLPGSASNGQTLYASKGGCSTCHMIRGNGGRLGPDLSRVGERRDPDELMSDIVSPHEEVLPRWWTVKALLENGSTVEGLRMNEDTFTLRVIDRNSELWSLPKNQIASFERIQSSTMPSYLQTLAESELDDLVAYLFSLRKEN